MYVYATGSGTDEITQTLSPETTRLLSVSPNPVYSEVTIHYSLKSVLPDKDRPVSITIFDSAGRRVAIPVMLRLAPGEYSARWDLFTLDGSRVPNGMYFVDMKVKNPTAGDVKKLVVVR